MSQHLNVHLTSVEQKAFDASPFTGLIASGERMPVIVVDNFPTLGRLAAMRFLEWVQQNPGGAASLPTGKTPEHFINWVMKLLKSWKEKQTQELLEGAGIDSERQPDMKSLHFVQIDEFYPIHPAQHNSFYYYVNKYYIEGFGIDRRNALLMDCSRIGMKKGQTLEDIWPGMHPDLGLRVRPAKTAAEHRQKEMLARVDQWCQEYEAKIRALGGIGFFLGGIGPDGHVGFNIRGSDHYSTTRLMETNYETQAAAAVELGGIEIARSRCVITIGLGTITYNPDCAAIIIAAGEAKAPVVADAILCEPGVCVPTSALHALPNARFYLTLGAAKRLPERQHHLLVHAKCISDDDVMRILVDCSLRRRQRISDLKADEIRNDPFVATMLAGRPEDLAALCRKTVADLERKITDGAAIALSRRFLHTEPHHDDIMLGYLPAAVRHVRHAGNVHYFVTLTSGFTSVTNLHMVRRLERLLDFIDTSVFRSLDTESYFTPGNRGGRNRDVWQYLDGVASKDPVLRDEGEARRLLRSLMEIFDDSELSNIKDRINELIHYFSSEYPGKKNLEYAQRLKGMCREWEAECLWGYFGWTGENVRHLRLGFYTGDLFTEEPTIDRDVRPILKLLDEVKPDIVTAALDPEASGPDTHYKALQALAEALRLYQQQTGRNDIKVWGYRNVWYRFSPEESNLFVPVSLNMFSIMENAFMNSFASQRDASFPSHEYDGPFCDLARKIQTEQYQTIKTCLGREWFHENPNPLIRATRGLVFMKEMGLEKLFTHCAALRHVTENR